jgi:GNAT superfamily N-acetyltransferase
MTPSNDSLVVRPWRSDDIPACLRLLETCLAGGPTGRRDPAFFAWKHLANPFGRSVALVAERADSIVGLRTFMRWELASGTRTIPAVRAVDTATHPAAQGQGIFKRLTTMALDVAATDARLVFNTPNEQSRPGYLKMGWTVVEDVPVRIRPVRPLRFARHASRARTALPASGAVPPACTLPSADGLGSVPGLDGLLEDVETAQSGDDRLRTRTTRRYLEWRYVDVPGMDYRFAAVSDGSTLRGLAIGRMRARGELRELTLTELVTRPGDRGAVRQLIRDVVRAGSDHVATVVPRRTTSDAVLRRHGFVRMPGAGITMTARRLPGVSDGLPDIGAAHNWALRLGDLELF